jgi:TonB family protein
MKRRQLLMTAGVHALALSAVLIAADGDFTPARQIRGPLPSLPPPNTIGWVDNLLEVAIDAAGTVEAVSVLQQSPLPRDIVTPAIRQWQFRPAEFDRRPVPARLLVAAMFRPPVLFNNPTAGSPPIQINQPSMEIPFPVTTVPPAYPPLAVADGVVALEVQVGVDGDVREIRVVAGAGPFAQASIDAARRWKFRPAMREGVPVAAYAYLVFGFRQPVSAQNGFERFEGFGRFSGSKDS